MKPDSAVPGGRLLLVLMLAGCGGSAPSPVPVGWCPEPWSDGGGEPATVTVALVEEVRPENAPIPTNDSEALVFRHLYEGLTDLDCLGAAVPALAESFDSEDGGRTWTFRLRAGARFTDGGPLDAAAVVDAWRERRRAARVDPVRSALWRDLKLRDMSSSGLALTIRLDAPDPDLPRLLAAPEFAVCRGPLRAWPAGTRERVILDRRERAGRVWTVEGPDADVRFVLSPGADPRDALLPTVDLLVTRRETALEHFAAMEGIRLTPLPWSRLYLVSATAAWPGEPRDAERRELAEQVVASTARMADVPALDPVEGAPSAGEATRAVRPAGSMARTLLVPTGDTDALAIAERIASRWARETGPIVVTPRSAAEVALAMANGSEAAVLAVRRDLAAFAHQRLRLASITPPGVAPPDPLVATRATLVFRAEIAGVTWGYDGVPRLDRLTRRGGATP